MVTMAGSVAGTADVATHRQPVQPYARDGQPGGTQPM